MIYCFFIFIIIIYLINIGFFSMYPSHARSLYSSIHATVNCIALFHHKPHSFNVITYSIYIFANRQYLFNVRYFTLREFYEFLNKIITFFLNYCWGQILLFQQLFNFLKKFILAKYFVISIWTEHTNTNIRGLLSKQYFESIYNDV